MTGGVYKTLVRALGGYTGKLWQSPFSSVIRCSSQIVSRSMVEVGGFEQGDTTFLTLENVTAVAFDDE